MKKVGSLVLSVATAVTLGFAGDSKCPDTLTFQTNLSRLAPEIKAVAVSEAGVAGLCEVVVEVGEAKGVVYTDRTGQFVFIGDLIALKPVSLITKNRVLLLNSRIVPKSTVNVLASYTDMVYNQGAKNYIYFISDPDCPYCKEAEKFLEKWAKERNVEVRVILFPLTNIHPQAYAKSVTMVCEGKGWEELKQGYLGKNECKEGKDKIEQNIAFMERLGIKATPSFIGMNGLLITGMPQDPYIFEKLIDMKLVGD